MDRELNDGWTHAGRLEKQWQDKLRKESKIKTRESVSLGGAKSRSIEREENSSTKFLPIASRQIIAHLTLDWVNDIAGRIKPHRSIILRVHDSFYCRARRGRGAVHTWGIGWTGGWGWSVSTRTWPRRRILPVGRRIANWWGIICKVKVKHFKVIRGHIS